MFLFPLLKNFNRRLGGVLQVGASYGQELEEILENEPSFIIFVEPLPEPFEFLNEFTKQYTNITTAQALCLDETGKRITMNVASNDGMSSSVLAPANHLKLVPQVQFNTTFEITSITVDDLLISLHANAAREIAQIDTLIIDVQGAELMVLKGARNCLENVSQVFCEVSHGGLYAGDTTFAEIQDFLSVFGFKPVWMQMNSLGWGDALFLK